jgi:asparagine synthase (glutamine-hydrolysing)
MSGLCGWFGDGRFEDSRALLEKMAGALPDCGRIQTSVASGPLFGLAIKAHPATGAFAEEGETVAAIEGYPRWRDPLFDEIARANGHARALLAAYQERGTALFDVLRGAFSFAVIDLPKRQVLSAIDRFGIQSLCYAQPTPDMVVFGSTTDAVRSHPKACATIPLQSIFDYLFFVDRIPAPYTVYREQRKLVPGEYLLMAPGQLTIASYWQMPYRSAAAVDRTAAAVELRERLAQAVRSTLTGEDDGSVGAFLSGGLDSSSVAGFAAGLRSKTLRTFTIGFSVDGFDEAHYAEIAARHFGTKHHTYYLQPQDVVDVLCKAAEIYDEPFANSSVIPTYHCARLAKEAGVDLMLAGDGGDELFAGNSRYARDKMFDRYAELPSLLRKGVIEPCAERFAFAGNLPFLGKFIQYVKMAQKSVPERMTANLFGVLAPRDVLAADALREIDVGAPLALAASIFQAPSDAGKIQRMMHLDLRLTLADSDLRKVVRMCELAGVRARFPFLDDDLAEFSAHLPEILLIEGGKLRAFYKEAMRNFLPDAILSKKKHGFGLPYATFMNTHAPLRELICDSLARLRGRRYFRPEFLDDLTDSARKGDLSRHWVVAWDLVALELWLSAHRW